MNLGNNQGVKPMFMPSSSTTTTSWKSGEVVTDQFPAGLRVLVVDDDPTCLKILEKMLRNCLYEVTKSNRAEDALFRLRENKNGFDIVLSDVHMPDMDGFKLLEHIGLEMDLPVIMMSADDSKNVVMKGVTHGACDYLIKPVRIEALRNIWQHVVRKKKNEWKDFEQSGSADNGTDQQQQKHNQQNEEADYSSSANEGNWRSSKRRKEDEDETEDRDDSSSLKKPRVVWSVELHQQFVAAVNQLGIDKAVPKKILELMNVPGLTRENVASHLQKYRLYLRRLSGVSQHHNGLGNSFMGTQDSPFGSMTSLNGLDLQALVAAGQLSTQSLATLQARSTIKSGVSIPLVDQRNLFSFESPKRFEVGQQGHNSNSNNTSSRQMNLLHGIPTNMEPKQLANLHHSQPFVGMNIPVGGSVGISHGNQSGSLLASQPRPQMLNDSSGSGGHVSRLPSSMGQPILSNGVLGRTGVADNVLGSVYSPASQSSSMVDFSMNHNVDLPGNSFPLGGNSGISRKGLLQEDGNNRFEMKGSRSGLVPNFDVFNELHQHKSQEWRLQNVGMGFDASHHTNVQNTVDVSPSVIVQQGFSLNHKTGQNQNPSVSNRMFSAGEESSGQRSGPTIVGQTHNMLLGNNAPRVKAELFNESSFQNTLYPDQFGQDDLMSALLKQQEDNGSVDNEFVFDGYSLDNLPV